jgi:hypothetical protein
LPSIEEIDSRIISMSLSDGIASFKRRAEHAPEINNSFPDDKVLFRKSILLF